MTLFIDTSVLLAASGSASGASRYLFIHAISHGWKLVSSGYCLQETLRNLPKLGKGAEPAWSSLIEPTLEVVGDVVSLDQALVSPKAKDRPVVVSALAAQADALLTLDRTDFHGALGPQVYGMAIQTPSEFLIQQRQAGAI